MMKRTNSLTDQIRQAIDDSGLTRYRISKDTKIDESQLAKFYNKRAGLSLTALDLLADYLQLTVVKRPSHVRQKGK